MIKNFNTKGILKNLKQKKQMLNMKNLKNKNKNKKKNNKNKSNKKVFSSKVNKIIMQILKIQIGNYKKIQIINGKDHFLIQLKNIEKKLKTKSMKFLMYIPSSLKNLV